jgi:hypothetical protein
MYTREQVIKGRLCGLKMLDKATSLKPIQEIIDESIATNKEMPNIWNVGWSNMDWAFGNAWRDVIWNHEKSDRDIGTSFNLDEALTEEQLKYVSDKTGIPLPYNDHFRERKKSK